MSGKNINFNDNKIKKVNFTKKKRKPQRWFWLFIGTNNSFKYFIRYKDNDVIRPLCVRLPQMTG